MRRIINLTGTGAGTALLTLGVALSLVLASCAADDGDGDAGLSRAEVTELVQTEMAAIGAPQPAAELTAAQVGEMIAEALAAAPQPPAGLAAADVAAMIAEALAAAPQPAAGLSRADVAAMIAEALAAAAQPAAGLSRADIAAMIAEALAAAAAQTPAPAEPAAEDPPAAAPSKSAPAEYTQFVVGTAVSRYQTDGRDAALDYYNRAASIDGQWYVFIIDSDDRVISHPDPERVGLDVNGWVGTDANGYNFGPEMLSATEDGKWVSYVYRNPESGDIGSDLDRLELKNVWVVEHDGLLFASGWYIHADEFTKLLVSTAVERLRETGLAETTAHFMSPSSELAGLEQAIAYYNRAETVDGRWSAFIAEAAGEIVAHSDPALIGQDISEVLGSEILAATSDGDWVQTDNMRMWVASSDGYVLGSGWHQP